MTSQAPPLHITELHKSYQMGSSVVHALAGLDLTIPAGGFTVAMGPSGSGKSTLLNLVGGLDRPTSGQILVNGQHVDALNENDLAIYRRKVVGFVFQSFNLVPSMTALENVAFPMRFSNIPRRKRQARAMELLERVGLSDRAYHRPNELSGGQQQRVAVARSLVNDPYLILADEPTGNLDTASGLGIMKLLAELHASGRTVLVVTHDLRMRAFATDVVHMLDGRIVSEAEYEAASNLMVDEESN